MKGKEMGKKYSKLDAVRAIVGEFKSIGETNADNVPFDLTIEHR